MTFYDYNYNCIIPLKYNSTESDSPFVNDEKYEISVWSMSVYARVSVTWEMDVDFLYLQFLFHSSFWSKWWPKSLL